MAPDNVFQYVAITQLLLHFMWTWIGIIVPDNDSAHMFRQTLEQVFTQNGICIEFTETIPILTMDFKGLALTKRIESNVMELLSFNGTLSFATQISEILGFREFLHTLSPHRTFTDIFIRPFWKEAFACVFGRVGSAIPKKLKYCTGEEKLDTLPSSVFEMSMTSQSYNIYTAVYTIALAFHSMYIWRTKSMLTLGRAHLEPWDMSPWQVLFFPENLGSQQV
uniref:Uncharacterized protein n=1 Tax=Sphaerodactylus townsendi TaxID=933632 RepID=A0ACB8EUP8_9SAUR